MLIAAFAALIAASAGARAEDHSPVIAIAKARASLSVFWASYDAPKPSESGHSLKVGFPNPHSGGEHIWMMEVKRLPNGRY